MPRKKHVPKRTCIACRQVEGKRGMVRLVRTENGIEIDLTGKKAGRGAYLHPAQECWQPILNSKRVDQALRTRLREADYQTLAEFAATLPESRSDE